MNLLKKNNCIIASFGEKELSESAVEIQKKLNSLLPIPAGLELRLSLSENSDLVMETLCALSHFAKTERSKGSRVILKAKAELIANMKSLRLDAYFDDVIPGE